MAMGKVEKKILKLQKKRVDIMDNIKLLNEEEFELRKKISEIAHAVQVEGTQTTKLGNGVKVTSTRSVIYSLTSTSMPKIEAFIDEDKRLKDILKSVYKLDTPKFKNLVSGKVPKKLDKVLEKAVKKTVGKLAVKVIIEK